MTQRVSDFRLLISFAFTKFLSKSNRIVPFRLCAGSLGLRAVAGRWAVEAGPQEGAEFIVKMDT